MKPRKPKVLQMRPIHTTMTLSRTTGTPAIAGMITTLLIEYGAEVTLEDERITVPMKIPDLRGLHVHINLGEKQ